MIRQTTPTPLLIQPHPLSHPPKITFPPSNALLFPISISPHKRQPFKASSP